MVRVEVRASLYPTESEDAVVAATTLLVPDAQVAIQPVGANGEPGEVQASGQDVRVLRRRIWERRVIDTFRSRLLAGRQGATTTFELQKQAAAAGTIALPVGTHALGTIHWSITVEADDPWPDAEAFVWWLCPETEDGEVVGDVSLEE